MSDLRENVGFLENYWYNHYSYRCSAAIPRLLYKSSKEEARFIVMDDLNSLGFSKRVYSPSEYQIKACVSWLAQFHACFLESSVKGLWEIGTYWNLETRPEELANMEEGSLKDNAFIIDNKLNNCKFQTIVHGDAKLENFCFSESWKIIQFPVIIHMMVALKIITNLVRGCALQIA